MAGRVRVRGRAHAHAEARRDRPLVARLSYDLREGDEPDLLLTGSFEVEAEDGARVTVEVDEDTLLVETRSRTTVGVLRGQDPALAGPLEGRAAEAEVRLRGAAVCDGDPVAVAGQVLADAFVPGSGGLRVAPERRPDTVLADAVAAGPGAAARLERAVAAIDGRFAAAAVVLAAAGLALGTLAVVGPRAPWGPLAAGLGAPLLIGGALTWRMAARPPLFGTSTGALLPAVFAGASALVAPLFPNLALAWAVASPLAFLWRTAGDARHVGLLARAGAHAGGLDFVEGDLIATNPEVAPRPTHLYAAVHGLGRVELLVPYRDFALAAAGPPRWPRRGRVVAAGRLSPTGERRYLLTSDDGRLAAVAITPGRTVDVRAWRRRWHLALWVQVAVAAGALAWLLWR